MPIETSECVVRGAGKRELPFGAVGQPALVGSGPLFLRQADAAEGVLPVRRIGSLILSATERDPEIGEQPHVAVVARLRRVEQRAVPVEENRLEHRPHPALRATSTSRTLSPLAGRGQGEGRNYQSTRTATCAWRGSPRPLCTVPSKLKMRLVTSGRFRFLLLNRLKTSIAGSMVTPPKGKPRE